MVLYRRCIGAVLAGVGIGLVLLHCAGNVMYFFTSVASELAFQRQCIGTDTIVVALSGQPRAQGKTGDLCFPSVALRQHGKSLRSEGFPTDAPEYRGSPCLCAGP